MAIRQEIIDSFQKDIDRKKQRKATGIYIQARERYIRNKKRGDRSIVIDEWDNFELERELKNKKERIEENIIMSDRRVLVRLSKAFNNVEVEVNNILTPDEFTSESIWAKNEAYRLIDLLPNEKIDNQLVGSPVKATPTEYVQAVQNATKPANGVYTEQHVTTKFIKGKQMFYALKGLNEGKIDINKLNNASSWDESNSLIFPKKKY